MGADAQLPNSQRRDLSKRRDCETPAPLDPDLGRARVTASPEQRVRNPPDIVDTDFRDLLAMEIEVDTAHLDRQRITVEIVVSGAPEISVEWTPYLGWSFTRGGQPPRPRQTGG